MWILDFPTLVLILIAGFQLGLYGFFGVDLIGTCAPSWSAAIYDLIGISAIWQLCRQRFF